MKVKIEKGLTFGWYSYAWDECKKEYELITFSLTKIGAKYALKRHKKNKETGFMVEEYEI